MAPDTSHERKRRIEAFTDALREHSYRAELIVYSSLLAVGVTQIIIRENFPNLQPPWPIIVIPLMIVLFGFIFIPPMLAAIRIWRKPPSSDCGIHDRLIEH